MVSIHASVKDATQNGTVVLFVPDGFNPRICKRCDLKVIRNLRALRVSIHASVKDATCTYHPITDGRRFQSTHL